MFADGHWILQFSPRAENLFTELIPALSGMSGKSSNSSMNFTNEDGSPIDIEWYSCSGGSHEHGCMTISFKRGVLDIEFDSFNRADS